jgi:ADP-heptose:LPS heptosyltransferase
MPERRWPAERFAAVADRGLKVVLTGTAAEADLTRAVADAMAAPSADLVGRTDLGATAALIARARLVVCNDTGVSHVAVAVRTPRVAVSTGDNPARWVPTDAARHCVLCNTVGLVPAADVAAQALDLLDSFADRHPPSLPPEGLPCARSAC